MTYYNYAHQIYHAWNALQGGLGGIPIPYPGRANKWHNKNIAACGAGGGPSVSNQAWPSCGTFVIGPPWVNNPALDTWVWGKWVQKVNQFSTNSYYETGFKLSANPGYSRQAQHGLPYDSMVPTQQTANSPFNAPRQPHPAYPALVPRALAPAMPDAPMMRETSNGGRFTYVRPGQPPRPDRPPKPPILPPHKPVPPRPRTKERKIKTSKFLRAGLEIAYAATETVDLIDAIWDALPKDLRKATPKTGKVMPGGRLPPGTPYVSSYDKAAWIYKHMDQVDMRQAASNIIENHIKDEIIGRTIGASEGFNKKNLNGNRLLNSEQENGLAQFVNKVWNYVDARLS